VCDDNFLVDHRIRSISTMRTPSRVWKNYQTNGFQNIPPFPWFKKYRHLFLSNVRNIISKICYANRVQSDVANARMGLKQICSFKYIQETQDYHDPPALGSKILWAKSDGPDVLLCIWYSDSPVKNEHKRLFYIYTTNWCKNAKIAQSEWRDGKAHQITIRIVVVAQIRRNYSTSTLKCYFCC
jgi:hypothetical protein